jgi:RNA polymerase sigma-70 factor (ECF subfamily)
VDAGLLQKLLEYRSELFGFIRSIVRNTHDAEDLFQEVCVAIVRQAEAETEIRDFRAWSKEVARRLVMKHFRQLKARATVLVPTTEMVELIEHVYTTHSPSRRELVDQHDALERCLDSLSGEVASLVRRRYAEDQPYDRIAQSVRKSERAVRRSVARARLALINCVRRRLGPVTDGSPA